MNLGRAVHWSRSSTHNSRCPTSWRSPSHGCFGTPDSWCLASRTLISQSSRILRLKCVTQFRYTWHFGLTKLVRAWQNSHRLELDRSRRIKAVVQTHPFLDNTSVSCRLVQETQLDVSWSRTVNAEAIHAPSGMSLNIVFQV